MLHWRLADWTCASIFCWRAGQARETDTRAVSDDDDDRDDDSFIVSDIFVVAIQDVDDQDMSKLRLYCPFMFKALEKAGALKKKDKRKPKKGDDDFDSDDEVTCLRTTLHTTHLTRTMR